MLDYPSDIRLSDLSDAELRDIISHFRRDNKLLGKFYSRAEYLGCRFIGGEANIDSSTWASGYKFTGNSSREGFDVKITLGVAPMDNSNARGLIFKDNLFSDLELVLLRYCHEFAHVIDGLAQMNP